MRRLKFTLFQCREKSDPMRIHELNCFRRVLKIDTAQLRAINIPYSTPTRALFDSTDVFLVGGSGDFSVLDSHRFLTDFFVFLEQICAESVPMFASCFGFQALCLVLGGSIIYDPQNAEVGSSELRLADAGKADPIFSSLPNPFFAQMGHKDRATVLPKDAVNLAFSAKVPFEAFKIEGKPIYATQFHPEMTMKENRQRFERYLEGYSYAQLGMYPDSIRNSFKPSHETYALLPEFINKIIES